MSRLILIIMIFLIFCMIGCKSITVDSITPETSRDIKYLVEGGIIDQEEAMKNPPSVRWEEINDLNNTTEVRILCYPQYFEIKDKTTIDRISHLLKDAEYVESEMFPREEPDTKLYFMMKERYIMAAKFYFKSHILDSPDGPIIKVDPAFTEIIKEQSNCTMETN